MNILTSRTKLQDEYTDQQEYVLGLTYWWPEWINFRMNVLTRMNWIDSKMNIPTNNDIFWDEYTDQQEYIPGWKAET